MLFFCQPFQYCIVSSSEMQLNFNANKNKLNFDITHCNKKATDRQLQNYGDAEFLDFARRATGASSITPQQNAAMPRKSHGLTGSLRLARSDLGGQFFFRTLKIFQVRPTDKSEMQSKTLNKKKEEKQATKVVARLSSLAHTVNLHSMTAPPPFQSVVGHRANCTHCQSSKPCPEGLIARGGSRTRMTDRKDVASPRRTKEWKWTDCSRAGHPHT